MARPFWEEDPVVAPQSAAMQDFYAADPVVAAPLAQRPAYSGSVLPISRDAQGNISFDSNAGLLGMLKGALALPGDVATGKTPIMTDDRPNPDLIKRSVDLAGLISPASAAMRAGERAIPGVARANTAPINVAPPTAEMLKTTGGAQLDAARNSGLEISGEAVAELARNLQTALQSDRGIIGKTAPNTFAILDELANPPKGGTATVAGLDAARRGLSDISTAGGTEGLAAGRSARGIKEFLGSLDPKSVVAGPATPEGIADVATTYNTGLGNYASALKSNDLTGALDRATTGISERAQLRAQAANSGRNIDNTIRQKVIGFLEKPKEVTGYTDDELEALRGVVKGGFVQNRARDLSNVLGAGGGLGQAIMGGGAGIAGTLYGGAPLGAALGLGSIAGGQAIKGLENSLARRSLSNVDELVRMNSPLYRAMLGEQPAVVPGLDRNSLLLRLLGLAGMPQSGQRS